jgi:hypothetical protein
MNLEIYKLIKDSEDYSKTKLISNDTDSIHWDLSHCVFIEQKCIIDDLKQFMEENKNRIKELGILKIYIDSGISKSVVEKVFASWPIYLYNRITYIGNIDKVFKNDPCNKDVGSIIKSENPYRNKEVLEDEILSTWCDLDTFSQNGFGVCNIESNCIRGWCLSEYNSPGNCGVGIETIEEYQRKGIALGMTRSFLSKCRDRNVIPYWDSWEWNVGSIKTAENTGFKPIQKYQTYFIECK